MKGTMCGVIIKSEIYARRKNLKVLRKFYARTRRLKTLKIIDIKNVKTKFLDIKNVKVSFSLGWFENFVV